MEVWKDVDLYEQGLKRFEALKPLQRDWFTIKNLDIYYEMEGGFEDYLLSGGNTPQLAWLEGALRRIGDIVSLRVISKLRQMNESQRRDMKPLCREYYERREERWGLLERRLEQEGVQIDESP
jgi:hypothetical protein